MSKNNQNEEIPDHETISQYNYDPYLHARLKEIDCKAKHYDFMLDCVIAKDLDAMDKKLFSSKFSLEDRNKIYMQCKAESNPFLKSCRGLN